MRRGWWIAIGFVVLALLLMYHDTIDCIGTTSPFDPNELVPTGTTVYTIFSHEQFTVVAFTLAAIFFVLPLEYIKRHPFIIAGIAAVVLAVAILLAFFLCPCAML